MNTYSMLKTIHIISSVVLVGVGFGSAFYLFCTNRTNNIQAQAVVARFVVLADWILRPRQVLFSSSQDWPWCIWAGGRFLRHGLWCRWHCISWPVRAGCRSYGYKSR